MSASLVGSEMCIRDRTRASTPVGREPSSVASSARETVSTRAGRVAHARRSCAGSERPTRAVDSR
eukprot:1288792-Alexandrium_andersonii.AAC.1